MSRLNTKNIYNFVPTSQQLSGNNEVAVFATVQSTSMAVSSLRFDIGNPVDENPVSENPGTDTPSSSAGSLSEGEIAGLVLACLFIICGVTIGLTIYWKKRAAVRDGVEKVRLLASGRWGCRLLAHNLDLNCLNLSFFLRRKKDKAPMFRLGESVVHL